MSKISKKDKLAFAIHNVICFACGGDKADSELEIKDVCQSCKGCGYGVIPDEKCFECNGSGECWQKVGIHKHCI
jgi:DnaJ-class molecular chaperone